MSQRPLVYLEAPTGVVQCLLADDDEQVRSAVARIVRSVGIETHEVADGRAALEWLTEKGGAALLISDIYMPGLDGIALLSEVKRRYPDTAVIMLTGAADVSTAVQCLRQGAHDFLTKPVLLEEVRARVEAALEHRRLVLEHRFFQTSYQQQLEHRVAELNRKNKQQFLDQIQMAVQMLEKRDVYTRGHSSRVAQYAVATGVRLGYTDAHLEELRLGGELHDIGKIGTRDYVLNKPGRLTVEEFEEIKLHTVQGEEILEPLREEHPILLQIVRSHHERVDGSGFPDRISGDTIPEVAKIVCVADAYDAMTTTRPYRSAIAPAQAIQELVRCADTQFDGRVVQAFKAAHSHLC